ncbi:HSP20 family protein OS=Castellaniella defragrans OX=75697 GN=HNR28_002785 PE=3 SV=1 [Castellaniella defragrans]
MRNLVLHPLASSTDSFPDLFHAFLRPIRQQAEDWGMGTGIGIDITESDQEFVLKAEIPGVSKDDIHVEIEDNTVTIRADKAQSKDAKDEGRVIQQERFWGQIERTISLSRSINESGAKATYQNGLLTLVLPKKADHAHRELLIE